MKVIGVVFSAVVLAMVCLAAPVSASDMGDRIAGACSSCHSTKKICRKLGTMPAAAWEKVFKGMIAAGAKFPKEDIGAAASYLEALPPGTGKICEY